MCCPTITRAALEPAATGAKEHANDHPVRHSPTLHAAASQRTAGLAKAESTGARREQDSVLSVRAESPIDCPSTGVRTAGLPGSAQAKGWMDVFASPAIFHHTCRDWDSRSILTGIRRYARQLGTAVTIAGADATNATISVQVAPGPLGLDLDMAVLRSLKQESASGSHDGEQPSRDHSAGRDHHLTVMTRDGSSERSSDANPLAVTLTRGGAVRLRLTAEGLRPSTVYAGQITLDRPERIEAMETDRHDERQVRNSAPRT